MKLHSPASQLVTHGPRDRLEVALTFDADLTTAMLTRIQGGGLGGFDQLIMDRLRDERVPATLFVSGLWARAFPGVLASLAADPHFEIGNHGLSHQAFAGPCFGLQVLRTTAEKRFEVTACDAAIAAVTGRETDYFRFPGGCHSRADVDLVTRMGKVAVQWDVNSGDAFQPDPQAVVETVLSQVEPGSIVVLHLNGAPTAPATARALVHLIPALRQRGFSLVTVGQLLNR